MAHKFSNSERKRIFDLVNKLIGTTKVADERAEIFLNNIERRIYLTQSKDLEDYLRKTSQNRQEHGYLLSSLTIHTTYWFRELSHFEFVSSHFSDPNSFRKVRALSLGCSTGEEVYSLALVLNGIRDKNPNFDFNITGIDIDPISIQKAQKAIYSTKELSKIPREFHKDILIGSGKTEGMMTLSKEVRERCKFLEGSALNLASLAEEYELAFCRNMLIYFDESSVNEIVQDISRKLVPSGIFILGHSENFTIELDIEKKGGSVFRNTKITNHYSPSNKPVIGGDGIDVVVLNPELAQGDDLSHLFQGSKFNFDQVEDVSQAQKSIGSNKVRVLITVLANQVHQSTISWLKRVKNEHKDLACVVIHRGNLSEDHIHDLEILADEMLSIDYVQSRKDLFKSRIATMVDIKKAGGQFSKLPVVIVDDDYYVAETFATVIESAGFNVKIFDSGPKLIDFVKTNPIQAVVSDFRMPEMDGVQLSREVNQIRRGVPFIIVSGFSKDVDEKAAYKILSKPVDPDYLIQVVQSSLLDRYSGMILDLDMSRIRDLDLLVIGGSTGAPQIFQRILSRLGNDFPPTVVVQHIPPQFQETFAKDLANSSGLNLNIVDNEIEVKKNSLYLAHADKHIMVRNQKGRIHVYTDDAPKYKGLRPCVHKLFETSAELGTRKVLGILLTGMGDDGSHALGKMREAGQYTIVQDLTSSTVFGMPKVAIDHDNVDFIGTADKIHSILRGLKAA